jgi:hypothetical protein
VERFPKTGKEKGPGLRVSYLDEMERVGRKEAENKLYSVSGGDVGFVHHPNWRSKGLKGRKKFDSSMNLFERGSKPAWEEINNFGRERYEDGLQAMGNKLTQRKHIKSMDVNFKLMEDQSKAFVLQRFEERYLAGKSKN